MLPTYDEIQLPLLAELERRGGRSRPRERDEHGRTIYDALAHYFGLTATDLDKKIYEEDGTPRSKWENMVRWTRNDLRKKGLLIAPSHGVWAVGDKGLRHLELRRTQLRLPFSKG